MKKITDRIMTTTRSAATKLKKLSVPMLVTAIATI